MLREIEDPVVMGVDIIEAEEDQREYTRARLGQLLMLLQKGQQAPHSYDPGRAAGERPIRIG